MLHMSTSFSLSPSLALLATVSRTPSRVTRCPTMPHYQPVSLRRLAKLRSKAAEATGQLTVERFWLGDIYPTPSGSRREQQMAQCLLIALITWRCFVSLSFSWKVWKHYMRLSETWHNIMTDMLELQMGFPEAKRSKSSDC